MQKNKYAILLVDDSEEDRFILRRAMRRSANMDIVAEVGDGEEAIAYLSGQKHYCDRAQYPFPDLLLLDLKMPRKSGYEVLEWLRSQDFPELRVVVLSGSLLPEDAERSLRLGAHAYQTKSVSVTQQAEFLQKVEGLLQGQK